MRHQRGGNRLSRRSEHRKQTLDAMAQAMVQHGRIKTTLTKGKEAKRVVERLITLGKDGSVASRRRAFQVLQSRDLVKQLFAEVAPRFVDVQGGYTRLLRTNVRKGDGAQCALLELTRLPVETPKAPPKSKQKASTAPAPEAAESKEPGQEEEQKPKKFLEGIRGLFKGKKGQAES